MNWEAVIYSGAGLLAGYVLGRYGQLSVWSDLVRFKNKSKGAGSPADPYDPKAELPQVIPEVRFTDTGEPIIAKEEVHHPSPIPRSLAIVLLILAALSVAYNAVQQVERNNDNARHNRELSRQVNANKILLDQYGHQQAIINANEQRLEDLVLAISTARKPGQVGAAIQHFLKSSEQAKTQEQTYQQQQQQAHPSAYQTTSEPAPSRSPQSRNSSSPSPKSSRSSSPSPKPSPKSSSPGTVICVQGVGCVTPAPLPTILVVGDQVHSKAVPAPVTHESFPWLGFAGVIVFTVGACYLISRRHDDPL